MTLVVSAFWTDPATGKNEKFTDWSDGHQMAGCESARQDLWGSEPVKRRGAKILPRLAESDLFVEPAELPAFVAEVQSLLNDVDCLQAELGWRPNSTLPHYLRNFLRAAEYAAARGGGINIT